MIRLKHNFRQHLRNASLLQLVGIVALCALVGAVLFASNLSRDYGTPVLPEAASRQFAPVDIAGPSYDRARRIPGAKDVILVAIDLPISAQYNGSGLQFVPTLGGLATGLSAYNQRTHHKWIGWAGLVSDNLTEPNTTYITNQLNKNDAYPLFWTQKDMDQFSHGFCSNILWPILTDGKFDANKSHDISPQWSAYQKVNTMFMNKILTVSPAEVPLVWIHDFQLMLLPQLLRQQRPRAKIGHFFHIPFPTTDHFAASLPTVGKDIIRGLLGADLVGFQIREFAVRFMDTVTFYGLGIVEDNSTIRVGNRRVTVGQFPIGIDYDKFNRATGDGGKEVEDIKMVNKDRKVILTVDRLDPVKALVERVKAYQSLLRENSAFREKVSLVMVVVPHRLEVEAFRILGDTLHSLIATVNRNFSTPTWTPITMIYKYISFDQLVALYRLADIAFVAPWRDGMNLVAKEYMASNPQGVLVLSRTAGAARHLTDAIMVDVGDEASMVRGLVEALRMDKKEVVRRARRMRDLVREGDVRAWGDGFIGALRDSVG